MYYTLNVILDRFTFKIKQQPEAEVHPQSLRWDVMASDAVQELRQHCLQRSRVVEAKRNILLSLKQSTGL